LPAIACFAARLDYAAMTDFTFLHAADLHLDSPLRGLDSAAPAGRIRTATRQALVKLVDFAIAEQVAFVLLAGDLYDSKNYDWHTGQFLIQQLGRLLRAGIEVVSIAGNHDPLQAVARKLAVPGMLSCDKPETRRLTNAPVAVHGQSYAVAKTLTDLSAAYPDRVEDLFNVGLLHTACGQKGHDNYAPCSIADLQRPGYDYWALGHVHVRSELSQQPWIVFPGNLQGRHVNEEGAKGATLVKVERGRVLAAEHVPLDVLRWQKLEVLATGAASEEDVWNRVRLALDQAALLADDRFLVVRVVLSGGCEAHADLARDPEATREAVRAIAAEVAGEEHVFVEDVRILTASDMDFSAMRTQPGAIGALIEALEMPLAIEPGATEFAKEQLGRGDGLLEEGHPAFDMANGQIPDGLAMRARALILAELARR